METPNFLLNLKRMSRSGLGVPLLVLVVLALMVVPLPAFALDIMFTFNIALSLIILLVGIYTLKPLDFAVFPTILLLTTLLRLALNVASTRVVLLHGHTGTGAAGKVIESFGEFVIGGNYTVGIVVFFILTIINFVVVTKGAGRISEVSARFTLDAMPGKQMAIDADLNAGFITQEQARTRREEVAQEADFYGAMDGASKFVRGDAVAGILILFINIIGGLIIGPLQHDMAFSDALRTYTLLTIGDGLVAQIPALILSTAAGILVTRVTVTEDVGQQIFSQLMNQPRALAIAAGVMAALGIIPGMPNVIFLLLAAALGGVAYYLSNRQGFSRILADNLQDVAPYEERGGVLQENESRDVGWDDVQQIDLIGLEVGYRLIPLVDKKQGGPLMSRIKGVRKKLSQELGFLIQPVHIRDNLDLPPNAYRISLMGVTAGESEIYPDREMAINPGQVFGSIDGLAGRDPAFGLEAVWIEPGRRDEAQSLGYTVVDASTVIATHVSQVIQNHAYELLGHDEVQYLLDALAKSSPKLAEDIMPPKLPLGVVVKVLQNLLLEHVPIRDLRTIAESLAAGSAKSQDPGTLTSGVRVALGRLIIQDIVGVDQELPVITLDPSLEHILHQSAQNAGEVGLGIEPGLAERLHQSLVDATNRQELAGEPAVLLVSAILRSGLAKFVRHSIPGLYVLSYNEIPDNKQVKIVATIGKSITAG